METYSYSKASGSICADKMIYEKQTNKQTKTKQTKTTKKPTFV